MIFPGKADTGLCGLKLCLFGGEIPESGVDTLLIIVSFGIGEQSTSTKILNELTSHL